MKKNATITVKLDPELADAIVHKATQEGVSKSEWMRRSLKHAIEEGLSYEVVEKIKAIKSPGPKLAQAKGGS